MDNKAFLTIVVQKIEKNIFRYNIEGKYNTDNLRVNFNLGIK